MWKEPKRCHSERSEESLFDFSARKNTERFFASLRMTKKPPLQLHKRHLAAGKFDQTFRLIGKKFVECFSHALGNGVIVRDEHCAATHAGIKPLQAAQRALIQIHVQMHERKTQIFQAPGALRKEAFVELHSGESLKISLHLLEGRSETAFAEFWIPFGGRRKPVKSVEQVQRAAAFFLANQASRTAAIDTHFSDIARNLGGG